MASVKLSDIINKFTDEASSGEMAKWIEKFESVARLQKITEIKSFLPLFLSGAAFAAYKQLSDAERDDYDQLKAALLGAFGTNSYAAYSQLRQRISHGGMTASFLAIILWQGGCALRVVT